MYVCPRCGGRGYVVTFPPAYDYYNECEICDGFGVPRDDKGRFRKVTDEEQGRYKPNANPDVLLGIGE